MPAYLDGLQVTNDAYYRPDDPGEPGYNHRICRQSVTAEEGQVLAERVRGRRVLEIGTGLGISTVWMAETAEIVYTYDIDEWVRATTYKHLAQIANVVCLTSLLDCPNVNAGFIDGFHTRAQVLRDTAAVLDRLARPGFILYHDACWPGVREALDELGPWELIQTSRGIGVMQFAERSADAKSCE